jgi:uncharacterized protein (TIGR00369 family)
MAPESPYGDFDPEIVEVLRRVHAETPLHKLLRLEFIDLGDGSVTVEMPVAAGAMNASGNLHGGAIATLCDVASGSCAARSGSFRPGENTLVTADLHVRYLGRPKGDVVRATARLLRAGRMLIVIETRVVDDLGNMIAVADFSGMVVPLRGTLRQAEGGDVRAPDM